MKVAPGITHRSRGRRVLATLVGFVGALFATSTAVRGQEVDAIGVSNWLTFSANVEGGLRATQFYVPHYDTGVFQGDSRLELWLPPFRDQFSWGLYLRSGIVVGSKSDWFQNAWLARPGLGAEVYPFSAGRFQDPSSRVGAWLGPVRAFAEYNLVDYWGVTNSWRPRRQTKTGFDYWKATGVNDSSRPTWLEVWNGAYWQSTNDVTDQYDSWVFATAIRLGVRRPGRGILSSVAPYAIGLGSRTKYDIAGSQGCALGQVGGPPNPCDFYWENNAALGVGVRVAPGVTTLRADGAPRALTRLVLYVEYLRTLTYYGPVAPANTPRSDVRVGISASIGRWYR
jgi:hypothetical protein